MSDDTIELLDDTNTYTVVVGYDTAPIPPSTQQYWSLEVSRQDASFTLPTSATPFIWDVVDRDTKNAYNAATGVTTAPFDGHFTFNMMFNLNAGDGIDIIYGFAQRSADGGATWSTSVNSGRRVRVATQGQNQAFPYTSQFSAGEQVRWIFYSTAPSTTVSAIAVPQSTAIVPAASLLITAYSIT